MTRLESIAGTDNPFSLMQDFGKGHSVVKAGSTVYVTKCQPVSVRPRRDENCTHEIPAFFGNEKVFVDPISFVIRLVGTVLHCNDIAPPRYLIASKWYCGYPDLRECHAPDTLHWVPVEIGDGPDIHGLGRSIYTKGQMEEFFAFQHAANARTTFLGHETEIAFSGRDPEGKWGFAMSEKAK